MVQCALMVRLEAKPGKEKDVENFLKSAVSLVNAESQTTVWFALKTGPTTYGIFDAFPDESGRQAHLTGKVAEALIGRSTELFVDPPDIQRVTVLADKIPGATSSRTSDLPPEAFAP